MGWWLASHAQTNPSGGFQGGVILATAFILIYLSGEFLRLPALQPGRRHRRGRGGRRGRLRRHRGQRGGAWACPTCIISCRSAPSPGAVSSAGTIALISFFVGLEVAAAFVLIVGELVEQTLLVRQGER